MVFMHDVLIFSKDNESHYHQLDIALSEMKEHELYVASEMCECMRNNIKFLGLLVGKDGIRVNPDKVKITKTCPNPDTISDLRSFLGVLHFFRKFIPDYIKVAALLSDRKKKRFGVHKGNQNCDEAFEILKELITSTPILDAPDESKHIRIHIDANQKAVGEIKAQLDENGNHRVIDILPKEVAPAHMLK